MSQTIGIFTYVVDAIPPWDPDTIKTGIAGSEEAVIYLSQKLAEVGYKVTVFGNPPAHSVHSLEGANPRFVSQAFPIPSVFDIAISWRMPHVSQNLKRIARKVYLWPHDVLDSRVALDAESAFDDVLWLSHFQREQWISVRPYFAKFTKIFGNGINPEQFRPISMRKNPFSCIYASNYARGLEVLIAMWPNIKELFPRATLDIYYGWQHWGLLPSQREDRLRKEIAHLPDVLEHGQVGHEELNRAYEASSFWTYPCTLPETFCISALRAQLAGAVPVIIKSCALKETVRNGYSCDRVENYFHIFKSALNNAYEINEADRSKMGKFIVNEFTWEKIAIKLKKMFNC
jgi:glycosyltransferase involved in cell wall biosynthesis